MAKMLIIIHHATFIMIENTLPAADRVHANMHVADHMYRAADSAIATFVST